MKRIKVLSRHNWYKCSNHFLKVDIKSLRLYQDSLHTIHCPPQPTKTFHDIISCSVIEFNVNLCRLWYCMILIHGYLLRKHAARMYFATTLVLIVLDNSINMILQWYLLWLYIFYNDCQYHLVKFLIFKTFAY